MNIYDIAEKAGVSIATVSKVINGKSDISQSTKEKVMKVMEENNYKPKLSSVNVRNIAIFAPISHNRELSNSYLSTILSGVGDVAFDHDYSITLVSTLRIPRNDRSFLKYCQQRKIFGGIFVLSTMEDNYIANFAGKIPLVVISRRFDNVPIATIGSDNFSGGYKAVKHLIDYGHQNILFIVPGLRYQDHLMRIRGGEQALSDAGLSKHQDSIEDSTVLSDKDLEHYLTQLMGSNKKPTAIFAINDHEAYRVIRVLGEIGIKVPDDVSIIGYDNSYLSAYMTPPLTTIYQPIYELGIESGKLLINMLENNMEPEQWNMELKSSKLILRESTRLINQE
jgi:DNA-binding LacI/PurR family transcriptional regulator